MPSLAPLSTSSITVVETMLESVREAALYAESEKGIGKFSFYLSLSLLALISLGFAGTAVYAFILGYSSHQGAALGGIAGSASMFVIVLGYINVSSRRASKQRSRSESEAER